jgi:NAD(P)-dependent dehydrogenase (short-subunit alcohol dehydrogenase family)
MPLLAGKVALVTGAGRRVGAAIAKALGAEGASVVVHYHMSAPGAAETAAAIEKAGGKAIAVGGDLRIAADVRKVIATARERFGRLDLLVSSAAVFEQVPFEELDLDTWEQMLRLNVTAPFLCAREALPLLRQSEGQIIHIADIAGLQAWPGYSHYCVSKAALVMLTKCLAVELAPSDVRVNAVAPGAVLFPDDYPDEDQRRVVARIPLARGGEPEDVARTVVFLATGPTFITGQVIAVDGGRSVAP